MTRWICPALVSALLIGAALLPDAAPARDYYRNCGNPPNWSGRLRAHNISCHKARKVFKRIRCYDYSNCTEIHSGAWTCHRQRLNRVTASGNCHRAHKKIRWIVYE